MNIPIDRKSLENAPCEARSRFFIFGGEISMDILLNRVFTNRELISLVNTGTMKYAEKASKRYGFNTKNISEMLKSIYSYLGSNHRNEYYYKNQLLSKIVLGKHSPNTTSALRELPVSNSIADFIIINGKAQVYEIKTELDTLYRLDGQLRDYYKAFKYVNVITDEKYVEKVKESVNKDIGIYTLTKRNQIHQVRAARQHANELDSSTMFRILRKKEFEQLNIKEFGKLPKVGASQYYKANFELFNQLSKEKQQADLTYILKQRYLKRFKGKTDLIKKCPDELKELVYFSKLRDDQIVQLNKFLAN